MSTVRNIMKKVICIAVTAALVVAFAFVLVACNDDSPVTTSITSVNDSAITDLRAALDNSGNANSYSGVITRTGNGTTEHTEVHVYSNGSNPTVYVDTEISDADGVTEREYILAGVTSAGRVYAIAQYDGDSTSPVRSNYYSGSSNTQEISVVIGSSGVLEARNTLLNILDGCVSLSGTVKTSGNVAEYTLSYDMEVYDGTLYVKTEDGMVTVVEYEMNGTTMRTEYAYNIGSAAPESSASWYEKHPRT